MNPVIQSRKEDHVNLVVKQGMQHVRKTNGLDDIELPYCAFPEINLADIDLSTQLFGKKFSMPLMVSGMTGGYGAAKEINEQIALACEKQNIPFQLGSTRAMLEKPELKETYAVKRKAKTVFLIANLGASNLHQYSSKRIQSLLDELDADALAIHTNPLQEAVQAEGTPHFKGVLSEVKRVASEVSVPVMVKEVGHGLDAASVKWLAKNTKVTAIDVAGAGGTSWSRVEANRGSNHLDMYSDVGTPTAVALIQNKKVWKKTMLASGGIRNGLDVVKCLTLGANACSTAYPVILAQQRGGLNELNKVLQDFEKQVRVGLFSVGAKNVTIARKIHPILLGKTQQWVNQSR